MATRMVWKGDQFKRRAEGAIRRGLRDCAKELQDDIRIELKRKTTGRNQKTQSNPGEPPGWQTGTLGRSVVVDLANLNSSPPGVRVGTNLVYARIHEFGGIIRAKTAVALAVPLNDKARSLRRRFDKLREVPGLKRWPHGDILGMFVGSRAHKRWEPLFVLKPSIKMPMRPYMRPGFAVAKEKFDEIWDKTFAPLTRRRGG